MQLSTGQLARIGQSGRLVISRIIGIDGLVGRYTRSAHEIVQHGQYHFRA